MDRCIKPNFEIQTVIDQKPFTNQAFSSFFKEWCKINNSFALQIISREEWESKKNDGILKKNRHNKPTLYLPTDFQLWEMIDVVQTIDSHTFTANPKRQNEKKDQLVALGKTFQNTGIYIATRLEHINEGTDIARELAEKFYSYGKTLEMGRQSDQLPAGTLAKLRILTPNETDEIDRFLVGNNLYLARQTRAKMMSKKKEIEQDEANEQVRQQTLAQFFRVSHKAFQLKEKTQKDELASNTEHLAPWQSQTSTHQKFISRIEDSIQRKIEMPKKELSSAIFRHGMDLLQKWMPFDKLPAFFRLIYLHWVRGEKTLHKALRIDQLKTELATVRASGNKAEISAKEREISIKIQQAVSLYPQKSASFTAAELLASQELNCVGASTLGGALMNEVGLRYLVGSIPRHSLLFLVTAAGTIEMRDMIFPENNQEITNEIFIHNQENPLKDVAALINSSDSSSIRLGIADKQFLHKFFSRREGPANYLELFKPEYGQEVATLDAMGCVLHELKRNKEAVAALQQALIISPEKAVSYLHLGNALNALGLHDEAINAYQQGIKSQPKDPYFYYGLGDAFLLSGRHEEAIKVFRQAARLNPRAAYGYYGVGKVLIDTDKKEGAIIEFLRALSLEPTDTGSYNGLGVVYNSLGRYNEAVQVYNQALERDPQYIRAYKGLGDAFYGLGNKTEALKMYTCFMNSADREKYKDLIVKTEEKIAELKK